MANDFSKSSRDITILIFCYNSEAFISEAISQIIRLALKTHIMIVDDGSTDNTQRIIKEFEQPLIEAGYTVNIYLSRCNEGVVAQWKNVVPEIPTLYFKPLAADDLLILESFRNIRSEFERTNADCIFTDIRVIGHMSDTQELEKKIKFTKKFVNLSNRLQAASLSIANNLIAPSVFFRTSCVQEILKDFPDVKLIEDWAIWIKFVQGNKKMIFMPEVSVCYRLHESQITKSEQLLDVISTDLANIRGLAQRVACAANPLVPRFLISIVGKILNRLIL